MRGIEEGGGMGRRSGGGEHGTTTIQIESTTRMAILKASCAIFVLNATIVASASHEQFEVLGIGRQWKFHELMMWTSVALCMAVLVLAYMCTAPTLFDSSCCFSTMAALSILIVVGCAGTVVVTYYKLGEMWHADPTHTVMLFSPFWNEGTVAVGSEAMLRPPGVLAPTWVYVMSDVVVRIYSFVMTMLIILVLLFGLLACCCGWDAK